MISNVTLEAICLGKMPVSPLTIMIRNVMARKCLVYMEPCRRAGGGRQGALFQYQNIPTYHIRPRQTWGQSPLNPYVA